MDFDEILAMFSPLTLTESVNLMKGTEPLLLTSRLGKNEVNSLDETCVFEVEEGSYNLAPMGYSGDPASNVNIARSVKPYAVTPPQIFMKDRITANEINRVRMAAQNPINMTLQDKNAAYNKLIGDKQQGLNRLIERRIEWLFAQVLRGKISYMSDTGRAFEHDFKLPAAVNINNEYWNKPADPGNPVHQLRHIAKYFKKLNNQRDPDLIVMGGAAGDAFMDNPYVEKWLQSAGVQIVQVRAGLAKGESLPIAVIQGSELFEHSATYEDNKGKAVPYIEDDYVYMTNSSLWRTIYGAINDFDAGNPPIVLGPRFSKMKVSEDGKALNIYVESHPLPVVTSNLCVVKAKVVD